MSYRLVIGDKNTSSWSLRPWLAMRHAGIAFSEVGVKLRSPDTPAQILRFSPSGGCRPARGRAGHLGQSGHPRVLGRGAPGGRIVARKPARHERLPARRRRRCIPASRLARALPHGFPRPVADGRPARSGRRQRAPHRGAMARLPAQAWERGPVSVRRLHGGGRHVGPVASRFRTYLPDLARYGDDGTAQAYVDALFALPAMTEWEEGARSETGQRSGSAPRKT